MHLRPFLLTKQKPGEVRHLRARRVMVLVRRYAPSIGLVAAYLCAHGLAKTLFRSPFSQNGGCPALGEHYRPHSQVCTQPRPTTGTTRRNLILGGSEASGLKPGARLSRSGAGWRACTGAADAERRAQRRFHRPFLHLCQILMEPCTHGITQPSHAWGKAAWRIAGVVRSVAFDRSRWGVDGHNRRTGRWRELNNIPRAAQLKWYTTEPPLGRCSSVGHPSTMGRLRGARGRWGVA